MTNPYDPIEAFAHRLYQRDNPAPTPLRFDRESVLTRLADGVAAAGLQHYPRAHRSAAELLYAFLGQSEWSALALARTLNRADTWVTRNLRGLAARSYAESFRLPTDGRYWHYRLTPAGEDWVQSLVQAPLPEPPAA